jgi:hypothetical protein
LVDVTEGLVNPKTLIWNGSSKNAPEIPPMEVKKEMPKATRGGIRISVSTPERGNVNSKNSMAIKQYHFVLFAVKSNFKGKVLTGV